jgi:hypothetical protein
MGMYMLVTITIPETEERTVALVEDLVTLVRKYPGVEMKTVTRQRSVSAGTRSPAAASKNRRSPVQLVRDTNPHARHKKEEAARVRPLKSKMETDRPVPHSPRTRNGTLEA